MTSHTLFDLSKERPNGRVPAWLHGSAPQHTAHIGDAERLMDSLSHADDLRGPLLWLGSLQLDEAAWAENTGSAYIHSLEENLLQSVAAARQMPTDGLHAKAQPVFAKLEQIQAAGLGERALPVKQGYQSFFDTYATWLTDKAATRHPLLDLLADLIAETPEHDAFARRLAEGALVVQEIEGGPATLRRLATARRGMRLLEHERSLFEKAQENAQNAALLDQHDPCRTFNRWLADSGLVSAHEQDVLALDMVKDWVEKAREARKGPCAHDCRRCPVGKQLAITDCATPAVLELA